MAKHKNGKKLDYFEAFEKQAELAIAEAKLLVEVIENYKGPDSLDDYIERAHESSTGQKQPSHGTSQKAFCGTC